MEYVDASIVALYQLFRIFLAQDDRLDAFGGTEIQKQRIGTGPAAPIHVILSFEIIESQSSKPHTSQATDQPNAPTDAARKNGARNWTSSDPINLTTSPNPKPIVAILSIHLEAGQNSNF